MRVTERFTHTQSPARERETERYKDLDEFISADRARETEVVILIAQTERGNEICCGTENWP